jgi:hypothetical protein
MCLRTDGLFIRRPCYLKLGDGTALSGMQLRADCFFRYWPLKDAQLDEEGYIYATAYAPRSDPRQVSEVFLRIDPLTGLVLEYRYMGNGTAHVVTLTDGEYCERLGDRPEGATGE